MNFTQFFVDKNLLDLLETVHIDSMKNRVLVGSIVKQTNNSKTTHSSQMSETASQKNPKSKKTNDFESIISLRKESGKEYSGGFLTKTFSKISNISTYHIFLISQKPLNNVDEEIFLNDDEIMQEDVLRESIEFNKIFYYEYTNSGDSSPSKKILPVENINSIKAILYKKEYHLKIKLETGKVYYFNFSNATEAWLWLNGLRKAVQTQEELTRSKCGLLKYNIGLLYSFHEHNKWTEIQDIINSIISELDAHAPIDKFHTQLEKTISEINYFCDAFFSYKPFIQQLFESMIKSMHIHVRSALMDFWNKNYLELQAGEILTIGKAIFRYKNMLRTWGVHDRKFDKCYSPIIITFCNRLFNSSKEILFNVIDEAMFKYRMEDKKYKNDSIRILETHINMCFDNYLQIPTKETARQLINMLMMIITIVQMNLITQVQNPKKNLDAEVLASLLNNDFDEVITKFMKKIYKKTKGQIQMNEIQSLINYEYLQRNNIKMSQECLKTLNNKMSLEVKHIFTGQRRPFLSFKLSKTIDEIDKNFSSVFLGLKNDHEKFDVMDKMCLELLNLYFDLFVTYAGGLNHFYVQSLIEKIPEDKQILLNYFRPFVSNDVDCHLNILDDLTRFLESDDYEETRILILKLISFFGDKYSFPYNLKRIIYCKYYFSSYQLETMYDEFNIIKRESDLANIEKKSFLKYSSFSLYPSVQSILTAKH